MLEHISANTRKLLVTLRCQAMNGGINAVVSCIDTTISSSQMDVQDQVALLMLKAELLHYENRSSEAHDIFNHQIAVLQVGLSDKQKATVARNRYEVAVSALDAKESGNFYGLVDHERMASISYENANRIADAYDAVPEGKHYEALPIFWQALISSYHQGCWSSIRMAYTRFARECLWLGWAGNAAYYAVMAQNTKLAEETGKLLVAQRNVSEITKITEKVISTANLHHHATIACLILSEIQEAVPDKLLTDMYDWLLARAKASYNISPQTSGFKPVWQTLGAIAPRFSAEQSEQVVQVALQHPLWNSSNVFREVIIDAVNQCVPSYPPERLNELASAALPLVVQHQSAFDYQNAINLLCHIAHFADSHTKADIAAVLYPAETKINSLLAQVAELFEKQFDPEQFRTFAVQTAGSIQRQFQRSTAIDQQEMLPGTSMRMTGQDAKGQFVAYLMNTAELEAVSRNRIILDSASIALLVQSILAVVQEPSNLMANRINFVQGLSKLSDCIDASLAQDIWAVLSPYASRYTVDTTLEQQLLAQSNNPLNPFKMDMGSYDELRGVALFCLSRIEEEHPEIYGQQLTSLIEQAMVDPNTEIRRYAFAATGYIPQPSELLIAGVLQGTRDANPETVEWALGVIAHNKKLPLSEAHWHLLAYSLRLACDSPHVAVRRIAATAVYKLADKSPTAELAEKMQNISNILQADVCYSVRNELNQ